MIVHTTSTEKARARRQHTAVVADIAAACHRRPRPAPVYGMCTGCRSIEVRLDRVTGTVNLSHMGESATYPTGYGCEVCS